VLETGRDAAFLTLGDAMTYSTFGYILRQVKTLAPRIPIVTVPGITSYQAAAARLNQPLVEGEESLLVLSGARGGDHLRRSGLAPDNVVFLKAYRNVPDIVAALAESAMVENSTGIACCGLPEEEIIEDVRDLARRPPGYWTLILAKKDSDHGK
jgi:precorrin-2/cobalt-factor-2 C20-methyltransferase